MATAPVLPANTSNARSLSCKPDPASAIAALPVGGIFHGSGCYATGGILISKPVTISGGTYIDPISAEPASGKVPPIIRIKDTSHVTVQNVTLKGVNMEGGYHRELVGEAGVDILSSDHVTLNRITTWNTFGDGLTVWADLSAHLRPTSNLTVNGYTVNHAGRQGVTVAHAVNSTLNDVTISSSADAGWDFESDTGVGSGNVTINRPRGEKGFLFQEILTGPITVNDSNFSGHVSLVRSAALSHQPVTFNRGTILIRNRFTGVPPAGIWVSGPGNLTFNNVTIGRLPAMLSPTGGAWSATGGAHLTFVHSTIVGALGTADAFSTVTIIP